MCFHCCGNRFQVMEVELVKDGFNIQVLGEMNSVIFVIVLDFDTKEPVEFTKVCDFNVFGDFGLELFDQNDGSCHYHTIVNMYKHDDLFSCLSSKEHGLVHIAPCQP